MKTSYLHRIVNYFFPLCFVLLAGVTLSAQDSVSTVSLDPFFDEARTYRNQSRIDLAIETLDKAAEEAEKNEDVKGLIDCYHELALLYLKLEKESDTQFYWDRASVLLKDVAYPYGDAIHKYIEAVLLYQADQNFQSLFMLNEAKQLNNDRNFINNILLTEAYVYIKLEKYDSATKNLNSLVVNSDIHEKDYLSTQAYLGLAKLYQKTNNYPESSKNAENALALAKENGFFLEVKEANEILSDVYAKMGLYENAWASSQNLLSIKDSLFTIDKLKTEAKTADKIRDDYKTELIIKQDHTIEELKESQNRSELTAILASAFLIIISLLAVSLYRNNQIKLKTNDLLQTKNQELQKAKDSAVQAMEAKTNFLSTVSHELRTPLYAVTGLTHLLLEENPAEHQKEHLKALKFSGDYLLNFINDILHINKIDADKLEPLNMEFNLKKILNEVMDSLQQSAKENNTKLILDYDSNIPSHLMSDPLKLSQIFINLIGNAIKFTKNGTVNVICKLGKKEGEDVTIYFEVKDNGIGISKEKQQSIFDGFEQGSIQINREYGGTGLGLTIVKSLLGLFESNIRLESKLGIGSSFSFEINMKSKDDLVDDIAFEITPRDYDFKGLHILIVEDNKINQVITKKMLTKKEITSDIASNGEEAVNLAKENTYDAILMDIHMPGISGEEATLQIRKFDKETPIIALTAISLDDSLESFYAAGCNDVVTKPFKPEVFYQKIGENIFDKNTKKSRS
ncbi:tetratricopeptide repeat-containing hybrid sensor histidine kinase/response regulator [Maribacter thermophilus]|uniref:tetratricopeptide repeat-containing hybrid sensor histidine kinase/response regulator n=1 Tax=Maribacter thermophilus TaxID=1197874 RepID=UPI000B07E088|nr:response regulator [Maribacter thermophilus]